jgi:hypothetical protein
MEIRRDKMQVGRRLVFINRVLAVDFGEYDGEGLQAREPANEVIVKEIPYGTYKQEFARAEKVELNENDELVFTLSADLLTELDQADIDLLVDEGVIIWQ